MARAFLRLVVGCDSDHLFHYWRVGVVWMYCRRKPKLDVIERRRSLLVNRLPMLAQGQQDTLQPAESPFDSVQNALSIFTVALAIRARASPLGLDIVLSHVCVSRYFAPCNRV